MDLVKSEKPSGTYYLVRMLAPYRFKPGESPREVGDEVVVDERLANYLSGNFLAAVLFREEQRIWVPV